MTSNLTTRIEQAEAGEVCGDHFPCPDGYIEWHAWAEKMSETRQQRQCPDCGLYAIWEPKPAALKAKDHPNAG